MKRPLMSLLGLSLIASAAFAGVGYSGKEIKQVAPPPCPEWYADREFNVSLWGTYVFTGNNWIDDRFIEAAHALRRTFLAEVVGSLVGARSKSTNGLLSLEKVSISSRQLVIQVARRGQS